MTVRLPVGFRSDSPGEVVRFAYRQTPKVQAAQARGCLSFRKKQCDIRLSEARIVQSQQGTLARWPRESKIGLKVLSQRRLSVLAQHTATYSKGK